MVIESISVTICTIKIQVAKIGSTPESFRD